MANTTISPNMNLPIPTVGIDPGPDWANNIDGCLFAVDSHNHTPGQGVPITPSAININADLPMNINNLITARSVRFAPQGVALSNPADLGCLYELGVDLFYIDGSGNNIRLTQSGAPAGATGTITGLPSGTASASFAGTTFTFESATNTPASMSFGPIKIAQPVVAGKGVTISPSVSQTLDYNLTLPIALPTAPSFISSDSSGNLSFVKNVANIRGPEGGGTVTLVNSDNRTQIFDLTADETVVLPMTGIVVGERWEMVNKSQFILTVQASDASVITYVVGGEADISSLVNTPVSNADWEVTNQNGYGTWTPSGTADSGTVTITPGVFMFNRVNNLVSFSGIVDYTTAGGSGDTFFRLSLVPGCPSTFTLTTDCSGTAVSSFGNLGAGQVTGNTVTSEISFFGQRPGATSLQATFSGQYEIK